MTFCLCVPATPPALQNTPPPPRRPAGSRWVNTVDPVGYLLRVVLPLHIHCEGGKAAGCPVILYPTPAGVIPVDRSALSACSRQP